MKIYDIPIDEYIALVYNELVDVVGDCRDDIEYEKIDGLLTLALKTVYNIGWNKGWNRAIEKMKDIQGKDLEK